MLSVEHESPALTELCNIASTRLTLSPLSLGSAPTSGLQEAAPRCLMCSTMHAMDFRLPQSASARGDGSDWSDLVASSDSEGHTSACTTSSSTASTASISLRATDVECTDMLQFLEQCLGLTSKDMVRRQHVLGWLE